MNLDKAEQFPERDSAEIPEANTFNSWRARLELCRGRSGWPVMAANTRSCVT